MGIKERKEREKADRRELILNTARGIMVDEGIDNISIRKIAAKIEYAPSTIYHYFKDKDDIINQLMSSGYQKIVDAISSAYASVDKPQDKLREMIHKYIETAMKIPEEYKFVQLNTAQNVVQHTATLFKGASTKKPALSLLFRCLKEIYTDQNIKTDDRFIELTAQVIATSTLGLILKLIVEKDQISQAQQHRLIQHYINSVINGIVLNNINISIDKGGL